MQPVLWATMPNFTPTRGPVPIQSGGADCVAIDPPNGHRRLLVFDVHAGFCDDGSDQPAGRRLPVLDLSDREDHNRRNVERTALVFSGGTRRAGFLCYFLGLSIGIPSLIDV